MERGGSSDVRWKTIPQKSGCNRKHSVADSGQTSTVRRTDRDVDEAERSRDVVVWLECLLVDVVRHAGMLAPDRVDICMQKQRP